MQMSNLWRCILWTVALSLFTQLNSTAQSLDLKKEYAETLFKLVDALLTHQVQDKKNKDFGAIKCDYDGVLHTRASESVYPFSLAYQVSGNRKYLQAAIDTGNWLIKQQEQNGSWKETPEEWTGTTTDQALMMMMAYEVLSGKLSPAEKLNWRLAMKKAVDYLHQVMNPEFASINYVATTCATLAKAGLLLKDDAYSKRATILARRCISKMDADGFLNGEGGRTYANKLGADLGYSMEMSLWGLGFYARLTGDTLVNHEVKSALKNHLYFVYPDGSLDNSWGIRSNKWTTYGGATSDGCQVLFSLYADEDPRYGAAAFKNLEYLRKNILAGGLIGYGPQHAEVMGTPCIYPTFTKAKNLAMAYALETNNSRARVKLPTEEIGWIKYFKTMDVALLRTDHFMATVTAYGYKDYKAGSKSKYMYRPAGGAISNLWVKDHGYLTASSVTVYSRPEPMSFPEAPGIKSLTPRIEFSDGLGYFTNLYEFDAKMDYKNTSTGRFEVDVSGELKDQNWLAAGVGYQMKYLFTDSTLTKSITLVYHDLNPVVKIIEPIINYKGMSFTQINANTIVIEGEHKKFKFEVCAGDVKLELGQDQQHYWAPYPALRAMPITLQVSPVPGAFLQTVTYRISML